MITNIGIDPQGAGTATFTTEAFPDGTGFYIIPEAVANPGWALSYYIVKGYDYYNDDKTPFEYQVIPPTGHQIYEYELNIGYTVGTKIESITAHFYSSGPSDSAVNLTLVSNPVGVGNLTGGGLKSGAVGSSANFSVTADVSDAQKTQYIFSHWIDDAGVRHNIKSFSKSFTLKSGYTVSSPEQKTFTAYFRKFTGLILRSASSSKILRGKANRILRDE